MEGVGNTELFFCFLMVKKGQRRTESKKMQQERNKIKKKTGSKQWKKKNIKKVS